jgi:hypothetical protein
VTFTGLFAGPSARNGGILGKSWLFRGLSEKLSDKCGQFEELGSQGADMSTMACGRFSHDRGAVGDRQRILLSIRGKLLPLDDRVVVIPGHSLNTAISVSARTVEAT